MAKVAIYIRVSKDEKADDERFQDPANQVAPLFEYCSRMGWEVFKVFEDRVSGGDSNRPAFKEMMSLADRHHFDGVVVWNLDRFSREPPFTQTAYVKRLRDANVFLVSYTEPHIDTRKEGVSDVMFTMTAWQNNNELIKNSLRTKAGIQKRKNIGQYRGGRPRKTLPPL